MTNPNMIENLFLPEVLTRLSKNLEAAKITAPTNGISRELEKAAAAVRKATSLHNKFLNTDK